MACNCDGKDCSVPEPLRKVCKEMSGALIPLIMKRDKTPADKELIGEFRSILFELGVMASYTVDDTVEETCETFFGVISASKRRLDEAAIERREHLKEAAKAVHAREEEEHGQATPARSTVPLPVFDAVRADAVLRSWNPSTATKH
jgi:hypothetical protein